MHGRASPGASRVNHFHSGQPGLCTQAMANKVSVGGILTLSMSLGAGLFVGNTLLNISGLLEGTKRSNVALSHLRSSSDPPHIDLAHCQAP